MALFSDRYVTGYALLIVPIAPQEMALAVWLIVKGFNSSGNCFQVGKEGDERALECGVCRPRSSGSAWLRPGATVERL